MYEVTYRSFRGQTLFTRATKLKKKFKNKGLAMQRGMALKKNMAKRGLEVYFDVTPMAAPVEYQYWVRHDTLGTLESCDSWAHALEMCEKKGEQWLPMETIKR